MTANAAASVLAVAAMPKSSAANPATIGATQRRRLPAVAAKAPRVPMPTPPMTPFNAAMSLNGTGSLDHRGESMSTPAKAQPAITPSAPPQAPNAAPSTTNRRLSVARLTPMASNRSLSRCRRTTLA